MRYIALGLVAVFAAGCAPAASLFDLTPRGLGAVPADRSASVRIESAPATFVATFAGMWADQLVFDVDVVNHSDSTLVLDPAAFSYTLTSAKVRLPKALRRPVPALFPEQALGEIDRWLKAEGRAHAAADGFRFFWNLADIAFDCIVVESRSQEETFAHLESDLARWDAEASACHDFAVRTYQQWRCRDEARSRMLHRSELRPGQSAHGSLFLPAKTLRLALGPDEPGDAHSITAPLSRDAQEFRLILRAPAELGAPLVEYALSRVVSY